MTVDVATLGFSRIGSRWELKTALDAFANRPYPAGIGLGEYDIHSPRVPTVAEMVDLLHAVRERLKPEQIWINPDCGLKTRKWAEVAAARILRAGP
ncbi:hypothetical protein LWC05_03615 [Acetobacter sicerae]|uniref:Cobalamin-independent methionine synthase MetE C-terminal/archaeal domain-containing protein n=1 Tax=Acetobacter sicerae TaxID=85325 RepID=A0ABS8VSB9_9PROT|nr:hypothetical protein [Acetobacter sicerae]MCE0742979.1 hypothetical protein [Acetobacter sicerae]